VVDDCPVAPAPVQADTASGKIDKSVLTISEPRGLRDKAHLKFVGSQPCLICARSPADAHHLKFTQPRAMGRKVSDEFTVHLCTTHHRDIHSYGEEIAWWERRAIDPVATARCSGFQRGASNEGDKSLFLFSEGRRSSDLDFRPSKGAP
jgi:hypothetical protein